MAVLTIGLPACDHANEETGGHEAGQEQGVVDERREHSGHGGDHEQHTNPYEVEFAWNEPAIAGTQTELAINITDSAGEPVNEFAVHHEKLLHLIIVNRELTYFNHIHPDYRENGVFTVNTTFPAGGEYKLFADFVPEGAAGTTLSEWVYVEGEAEAMLEIEPDPSLITQVNGIEVELQLSNTLSNEEVVLTYHFQDAETKQGIDRLEPYLGAVGHVVIMSEDAEEYIHVHPLDENGTGPTAEFVTTFPHSGVFKAWGQFQYKDEIVTIPFVLDIQ
ncbi:hypothetical protein JCM10914_524 [Paenibacillus sp. JCM 10914]|nr:hypothetical protein JCM10914_524 [Paenibacillus sp. JCM 10914]